MKTTTINHFRSDMSRVKRQNAEDSDYHYGPNHNAPHFVIGFNGDLDIDGGGVDIEIPDVLGNTIGGILGILPPLPFGKKK